MPARSWKKPASKPVSNSVPRSGLRLGLPGLAWTTPGPTPPLGVTYGKGAYVVSDAPGSGERPVDPYAARRRKVEIPGRSCCQKGSCDRTYDTLTFGRKREPNAF